MCKTVKMQVYLIDRGCSYHMQPYRFLKALKMGANRSMSTVAHFLLIFRTDAHKPQSCILIPLLERFQSLLRLLVLLSEDQAP